jgi:hypothetical protein
MFPEGWQTRKHCFLAMFPEGRQTKKHSFRHKIYTWETICLGTILASWEAKLVPATMVSKVGIRERPQCFSNE